MKNRNAAGRLVAIQSQVDAAGFLTIADLALALGVSEMTIRRDTATLAASGRVRTAHGGVHSLAAKTLINETFQERVRQNSTEKDAIARLAVTLIGREDSIAIDAGSTTLRILNYLPDDFVGSIVTHSVPVVSAALGRGHFRTIVLGGDVLRENASMVGPLATEAASCLRIRRFFMGAAAIDDRGVYVAADIERPTKKALMSISDEVILLVDETKFSRSAPVLLCNLDDLDLLVTDRAATSAMAKKLADADVAILAAEDSDRTLGSPSLAGAR